jgi:hypothetical protein
MSMSKNRQRFTRSEVLRLYDAAKSTGKPVRCLEVCVEGSIGWIKVHFGASDEESREASGGLARLV